MMPKTTLKVCPVGSKGVLSKVEVPRDIAAQLHREIEQSKKQGRGKK